jgi:hypothetical protein
VPATTLGKHPAAAGGPQQKAPALLVPFTRAAKEHIEPFVDDTVATFGASSVQRGPFDVPAYGYMRYLVIQIDATGGTGTSVTTAEDGPWSVLQEVSLIDVNGAPIVGPLSGYDLYLINKYGGYAFSPEPKQSPQFSAVGASTGNFSLVLRVPVEISPRDALGSLANMNGASTYKLKYTIAPTSQVYGTVPATPPAVRVRAYLEAWTQPAATDLRGNPAATEPPAHGTTSYWSKTVVSLNSGQQTVRLPRVGNYIRGLFFIFRDGSNTRSGGATQFPDPAALYWDTRLLKSYNKAIWRDAMVRKTDFTATVETARGLDNGVFVEDYCHDFDGQLGHELRDGWLPTVQSTRLELQGSFGSSGSLTVITNDVSPAGEVFV